MPAKGSVSRKAAQRAPPAWSRQETLSSEFHYSAPGFHTLLSICWSKVTGQRNSGASFSSRPRRVPQRGATGRASYRSGGGGEWARSATIPGPEYPPLHCRQQVAPGMQVPDSNAVCFDFLPAPPTKKSQKPLF